ncbi:hypothetical protein ACU4GD_00485 [Cupriavidus basilensis]
MDRTEIINAAKALRASQEESRYSKLVALANKQPQGNANGNPEGQGRIRDQTGTRHQRSTIRKQRWNRSAQRLADDLRTQGYTATVTTLAEVSTDRKELDAEYHGRHRSGRHGFRRRQRDSEKHGDRRNGSRAGWRSCQ